jgi:hypothetical protein
MNGILQILVLKAGKVVEKPVPVTADIASMEFHRITARGADQARIRRVMASPVQYLTCGGEVGLVKPKRLNRAIKVRRAAVLVQEVIPGKLLEILLVQQPQDVRHVAYGCWLHKEFGAQFNPAPKA